MNQAAPPDPLSSIPFIGDITDPSVAAAPEDGAAQPQALTVFIPGAASSAPSNALIAVAPSTPKRSATPNEEEEDENKRSPKKHRKEEEDDL